MYETYPKPNKNPSASVGEQEQGHWESNPESTRGYVQNGGAKDTVYNGDKSKTISCEGGSGKANKNDYPKSRTKFGTEK